MKFLVNLTSINENLSILNTTNGPKRFGLETDFTILKYTHFVQYGLFCCK